MLFLALRHLSSRKRQTILTLLGIVLGTAAYIAISGMMMGFQTYIIDQLINNDAHIRVSAREEVIKPHSLDREFFGESPLISWVNRPSGRRDNSTIEYAQGWFDRLDRDPAVVAYSPQLSLQVIARRGKVKLGVKLLGCEPERQARVTNIEKYMTEGSFKAIGQTGNRIVVGDGLLEMLGAQIGEMLQISSGSGTTSPFQIVGIFHLGIKNLDDTSIFGSLAEVQRLNQTPSRISDIAVRLSDVTQAGEIARNWSTFTQEKVQSWDQANEGTLSVFRTQDIVRNSMTLTILIVAGFGIYNILNMAVTQKRREIAILRSMGYEPGDILRLFLVQGLMLGATGGLIGLGVGYALCLYIGTIPVSGQRFIGGGHMMVSYDPMIFVRGYLIAFVSATVASLLPARAAGKLTPIEIIRSEGS